MLHKFFSCASVLCLLALTLALLGCSGSGSPLIPEIQEITIISPTTGSEWGSPEGVWEIVFFSPDFASVDLDYNITIDEVPVILNSFQDLENEKGILAHIVVSTLSIGDHQLVVEAMLFDQVIAKGQTNFMVKPERELSITITEPNVNSDWDIGDTETISWEVVGDKANSFEVGYSEDAGTTWHPIGTTPSTSLEWEIPVVNNPAGEDFLIQVIANDGIATGQSSAFRIDYGPVVGLVLIVPQLVVSVNTPFTLTIEVRDQYGNLVKNYNEVFVIFPTWEAGSCGSFNYTVIGDGIRGTWNEGIVSYSLYEVEPATTPPLRAAVVVVGGSIASNSQLMTFMP